VALHAPDREAAERRAAEQKKLITKVEANFYGKSQRSQQDLLDQWRITAARDIPQVENARKIWENDHWNPDSKAWRETRSSIQWETGKVEKNAKAVQDWHGKHPVQSLVLRTGLKQKPRDLQWLEQEHASSVRFLTGSQKSLAGLEQRWLETRPDYERKIERQGQSIQEAREALKVIKDNPQHFQKVFQREAQASERRFQEQEKRRNQEHDRDRGGWSR
jgi:hypothetical protein